MNNLLLSAGAIGLFTTALHIFGGQVTLIRPFLQSDIADDIKGCLLVCWHVVSAYLLLTSCLYLFAGFNHSLGQPPALEGLLMAVSGFYVLFAVIFIAIGAFFFGHRTVYKLPQWVLLLPVGVLGLLGAVAL